MKYFRIDLTTEVQNLVNWELYTKLDEIEDLTQRKDILCNGLEDFILFKMWVLLKGSTDLMQSLAKSQFFAEMDKGKIIFSILSVLICSYIWEILSKSHKESV